MNVVPVFNENDAISKGAVKSTVSLHQTKQLLLLCRAAESSEANIFSISVGWILGMLSHV